jgi:hypothetical protein
MAPHWKLSYPSYHARLPGVRHAIHGLPAHFGMAPPSAVRIWIKVPLYVDP